MSVRDQAELDRCVVSLRRLADDLRDLAEDIRSRNTTSTETCISLMNVFHNVLGEMTLRLQSSHARCPCAVNHGVSGGPTRDHKGTV